MATAAQIAHAVEHPSLPANLEGKDGILFIGQGGVGKSCCIEALSGSPMQSNHDQDTATTQLDAVNPQTAKVVVGHGMVSTTAEPKAVVVDDMILCDLPGVGDNRGGQQEISNAVFTRDLNNRCRRIKVMLTVNESSLFDTRGAELIQTVSSICARYSQSNLVVGATVILVTKTDRLTTVQQVRNKIEEIVIATCAPFLAGNCAGGCNRIHLANSELEFLRGLLRQPVILFAAPPRASCPYDTTNLRLKAREAIAQATFANVRATISLSPESEIELCAIVENTINDFNQRVGLLLARDMQSAIAHFLWSNQNQPSFQRWKAQIEGLVTLQTCGLASCMHAINALLPFTLAVTAEVRRIDSLLLCLLDLLPAATQVRFPYDRDWLSSTGLRLHLTRWVALISAMLSHPEITATNGKMMVRGHFVKVSEIPAEIRAAANSLEIFSLLEVCIDAHITLHSGDVTIISPTVRCTGAPIIDLTGNSALAHVSPAPTGVPGAPGLPGTRGGHWFCLGDDCKMDGLVVKANGGNGGPGQKGGCGMDGSNGSDGSRANASLEVSRSGPFGDEGWWWVGKQGSGTVGCNGSDGQPGGLGGLGGPPGNVRTIVAGQQLALNVEAKVGADGQNGDGGAGGAGGLGGQHYGYTHNEGHQGSAGYQEQDHGFKGRAASGSAGTTPQHKNAAARQAPPAQTTVHPPARINAYVQYVAQAKNILIAERVDGFCALARAL